MKAKNYHFEQDVASCQAFAVFWLNESHIVSLKFSFCVKTKSICNFFPFYASVWGLRKSLLPEIRCCVSRNTCSVSSATVTISQDDHTSLLEYEKLLIFSWRVGMKDSIIILLLYFFMVLILTSINFFFFCCSSVFTKLWLMILLWWQSMLLIKMLVFVLKSFALR